MGPNTSPKLFNVIDEDVLPALNDEAMRQAVAAPVLHELNELFNEKDASCHPVTEPTLLAKFFALSLVQRTRLGITGFDPLTDHAYAGRITASTAPWHDEFKNVGNATYRTQIIRFSNEDYQDNATLTFGINMFTPQMDEMYQADTQTSKLIVVDHSTLEAKQPERPVSGETSVIGVYANSTHDAKLYHVQLVRPETAPIMSSDGPIKLVDNHEAYVTVPDGQVIKITQLTGELLEEAVQEFEKGVMRLKQLQTEGLTAAEKAAVSSVGFSTDLVGS